MSRRIAVEGGSNAGPVLTRDSFPRRKFRFRKRLVEVIADHQFRKLPEDARPWLHRCEDGDGPAVGGNRHRRTGALHLSQDGIELGFGLRARDGLHRTTIRQSNLSD